MLHIAKEEDWNAAQECGVYSLPARQLLSVLEGSRPPLPQSAAEKAVISTHFRQLGGPQESEPICASWSL